MTKYYLTKIIYNGLTYFFIWYCRIDNMQYHSFMSNQELYDAICEYI